MSNAGVDVKRLRGAVQGAYALFLCLFTFTVGFVVVIVRLSG